MKTMQRSLRPEIMDAEDLPEATRATCHRDLRRINALLGHWEKITRLVCRGGPARRVLDIGCGDGALLDHLRRKLGVDVVGVELVAPKSLTYDVPIVIADATRDALPAADVAISVLTLHHMTEEGIVQMLRNTGQTCPQLIVLDLVRHRLPLVLFSLFIAPLLHREAAADGRQSIRRAFTPAEMAALVAKALQGSGATWRHTVSPYRANQVIEIDYAPVD